jgi:cytochrome c oxidase subunit II
VTKRVCVALTLAGTLALAGCGKQSTLSPQSSQSHAIAVLWWWMLGVAGVVFLGAVGLLLLGWWRRGRPGFPIVGQREGFNLGLVIVFGIVIPVMVLVALFAVSDIYVLGKTEPPKKGTTKLTVDVIGHQWFWEVRYPGTTAVTANQIHIPAHTRVNVVATTADVIHSFWVPELNRKIDMIPGQRNRVLLDADQPGTYRGQCAEFCGLQHAHMAFEVVAQPPRRFHAWLANMSKPGRAPTTAVQRRGQRVFLSNACASCHTIRGTPARGDIGPDLTHLATRSAIAAETIPNTRRYLGDWIRDPQHIKPGNLMPGLKLSGVDVRALVAYLGGLR